MAGRRNNGGGCRQKNDRNRPVIDRNRPICDQFATETTDLRPIGIGRFFSGNIIGAPAGARPLEESGLDHILQKLKQRSLARRFGRAGPAPDFLVGGIGAQQCDG
jgi:hypothetical protein